MFQRLYPNLSDKWIGKVVKAAKVTLNGDVKNNGSATVENGVDEEDIEAGPEMPPEEEEEEEAGPDDEEGRFFGSGITNKTADVLDFMDKHDETLNVSPASCIPTWPNAENSVRNLKRWM